MNKKKIITGIIGLSLFIQPLTGNSIYADNEISITQTLKAGMRGESVVSLQKRLENLGYFNYKATGYFGNITKESVKKFQRDRNLYADGIAGKNTIAELNKIKETITPVSRGVVENTVSNWTWFGKITNIIPRGTTFKVIDVYTGKEFNAKRTYGTNHADTETLTKEDTRIMKELYGGKWSWDRRPIIVEVDGIKIPASMDGMPHGSDFISDNNMEGHFDIHFLLSKTHGSNRVEPNHQKAVKIANQYLGQYNK
ncbi:peptidoglycan-binding domain-containing protein [Tepidibacter sp. Z1-5]|uniref:peptidoglycan-binding domain-containing protein n=1 Tax=Tepidibacter sp. Z1-5 TaxID=3134138 RepID=UPI0030C41D1A